MSKKLIIGNWKMYKTTSEAEVLAKALVQELSDIPDTTCEIVICPPYTSLDRVSLKLKNSKIKLGAQDLHWQGQGAFTGKVSGDMLKDIDVDFVIIGHSEQRTYFHESNESINKKIITAIKYELSPVVCVGETLLEREDIQAGSWQKVITTQLTESLRGLSNEIIAKIVLAYEPVWAIGTGRTANSNQAQEVHCFIRSLLKEITHSETIAREIRILYGGSVKPENAKDLFTCKDIDGGLIGGASLEVHSFAKIVRAV